MVSAEHVAKGVSAKLWVDHLVARAGRGKGERLFDHCVAVFLAAGCSVVGILFCAIPAPCWSSLCQSLVFVVCIGPVVVTHDLIAAKYQLVCVLTIFGT